jgi:predicted nucleotidyltransferase
MRQEDPVTREEVKERLAVYAAELRELGVRSLELFGSTARNQSRADSDVDLLVEFDRPVGLFHFAKVQQRLESILGRRVDLGTKASLKPRLRDAILHEAVRVA